MEYSIGLFAYSMIGTIFLFGAIVGSFLNVVILRHNTGKSLAGRSGCMSCQEPLLWWQLVPILSFVLLKGRCVSCKSKISWQYPIVELLTAILFVLTYISSNNWLELTIMLPTMIVLVVLATYDYKHTILPDLYSYTFTALAVMWSITVSANIVEYGWHMLGGVTTALPIFAMWYFSRGRAMGFGDVKLSVGIGIFLGVYMGVSALWYAFVLGAIYGLVLMALRKAGAKSEVPFGPFLILGFLLALLTKVGFIELISAIIFI